jgi:hypothetical protein
MTEIAELGAEVFFKPIWTEELQGLAERLLSRSIP